MEDLYKKLQVDPQAESEIIRAAYHALARKYHPDAGGDTQRMVEFNAAWAVLGDPIQRSAYDAERDRPVTAPVTAAPPDPTGSRPAGGDNPPRSRTDSSSILDFGRYAGWSLAQLLKSDPDYLEWLVRTPIGRRLSAEVKTLLEARAAPVGAAGMGHRGARGDGPTGAPRERGSAGRLWFGRMTQSR